jgi:hypothetical protein
MRGADDPKNRESWKKVLGSRGKRDIYVERTTSGLNPIQGTILSGSDDGKMFEFELESGDKKSLLQRTATGGLIFAQPTPTQVPQTLCKVIDVFGNSLVAQSVQVNGESVTVTTVAGVVVKYPTLAGISRFDYAQGNVAYLSDLEPQVTVPPVPPDEKGLRLNVTAPFLRDHGLSGEALKFGSDPPFPKGIVITSDVELTYNIGGDYREFKAVLGMPENIADANLEAKVIIMADDKIAFSETIKRKDKPRSIGLDVKGVKQLRVIVDSEMPVTGSRVVLADARVQK